MKYLQATAPSSVPQGNNAQEKTFYKLVEQSEWITLLQSVMQVNINNYIVNYHNYHDL